MFAPGFPSGIAFALASRVGDTSHDEGALHMLALVAALHGGEICDLELQRRAVDALLVIRKSTACSARRSRQRWMKPLGSSATACGSLLRLLPDV